MKEIGRKGEIRKAIGKDGITFLVLYSDHCPACMMIRKAMEEIDGEANVVMCNVDRVKGVLEEFPIMAVPTTNVYVNGEYRFTIEGAYPPAVFRNLIRKLREAGDERALTGNIKSRGGGL